MAPTPGPWTAARGGTTKISGKRIDYPATVRHVYHDEFGRRCIVFVASCEATTLPNDENAVFIAAAPEMFDALHGVITAYRQPDECTHGSEPDICDGCRYMVERALIASLKIAAAAIAKAEGR